MPNNIATQFKQLTAPSGKKAFEAVVAVWNFCGDEVCIAAPNITALEDAWKRIVTMGPDLDLERVQHIFIVAASDEAPKARPEGVDVKCSACEREAAFIIKRVAYCESHRP